jgi:hypothetical protein
MGEKVRTFMGNNNIQAAVSREVIKKKIMELLA